MSYAVRTATNLHVISTHACIDDAVASLETEQLADDVHPDPRTGDDLELVITHDDDGAPGEVVVHFTASRRHPGHLRHADNTA